LPSVQKRVVAYIAVLIVVVIAYLYVFYFKPQQASQTLIICHAGSLTVPLRELATLFEQKYHVKVVLEPAGSVMIVRWITDLGKRCDVVALADYRLIPMYLVPRYASWYIAFATNSIVIAYTDKSRYASFVSAHPDKIFDVLARRDVRYGFSNPNDDPCGYRAVGVIALASIYYHNMTILKDLVLSKISGARVENVDEELNVYIPVVFNVRGNLVVRPKSVDLLALLESGDVDYAFEYKSVAVQHGLRFVELPPALNLGDSRYSKFYSKVIIHILVGTKEERSIKLAPIVYGLTIPSTARNRKLALLFVKFLLSSTGREIFNKNGQNFLKVPLGFGKVPAELREYVKIVNATAS